MLSCILKLYKKHLETESRRKGDQREWLLTRSRRVYLPAYPLFLVAFSSSSMHPVSKHNMSGNQKNDSDQQNLDKKRIPLVQVESNLAQLQDPSLTRRTLLRSCSLSDFDQYISKVCVFWKVHELCCRRNFKSCPPGHGWGWDVVDLGSWVRLHWFAHDEAPGPYITIPQYRFNKTN